MNENPRQAAAIRIGTGALLVACAIIGLWLFSFSVGYGVGKDIALSAYGTKE